jgi:hypothetical protein
MSAFFHNPYQWLPCLWACCSVWSVLIFLWQDFGLFRSHLEPRESDFWGRALTVVGGPIGFILFGVCLGYYFSCELEPDCPENGQEE